MAGDADDGIHQRRGTCEDAKLGAKLRIQLARCVEGALVHQRRVCLAEEHRQNGGRPLLDDVHGAEIADRLVKVPAAKGGVEPELAEIGFGIGVHDEVLAAQIPDGRDAAVGACQQHITLLASAAAAHGVEDRFHIGDIGKFQVLHHIHHRKADIASEQLAAQLWSVVHHLDVGLQFDSTAAAEGVGPDAQRRAGVVAIGRLKQAAAEDDTKVGLAQRASSLLRGRVGDGQCQPAKEPPGGAPNADSAVHGLAPLAGTPWLAYFSKASSMASVGRR